MIDRIGVDLRPARLAFALISLALLDTMAAAETTAIPPVAKQIPHIVKSPHGDRIDEYYWMRDDDLAAKRPDIIEHLNSENAYTDAVLTPLQPLQNKLIAEMRSRIKEDDSTVPSYDNGYWYWRRFDTAAEYPVFVRQSGTPERQNTSAPVEVVLDLPQLAAGRPYFHVGAFAVSPNREWLAWTEDSVGRRMYELRIKNLASGQTLSDRISGVLENLVWAADNRTLFYIKQDPQLLQSGPVFRHTRGTDSALDTLVYDEKDKTLFTSIARSASREFLLISVTGFTTTETLTVPSNEPGSAPKIMLPRRSNVRSYADHFGQRWIIRTNDKALNFRLVDAPAADPANQAGWKDIVPAREDAAIDNFALLERAIVVEERIDATLTLRVLPTDGTAPYRVPADEVPATLSLGDNLDPSSPNARYTYTSMVTPPSTFDVAVATGERHLRKRQPAPGYEQSRYSTERLWATSRDGKRIPISIAYRKDLFRRDGSAPLYIDGYGSYGYSNDPYFSSNRVSLLDRGFVVAIAHVRGGAELGQAWYEDGKLSRKKNTFNDFVDATDFLVRERYGARHKVFASGGSAGGLLMGVIANEAGDRYRGIALNVPFVDAVTTMLD
ncbi:MAG: prolyl oligopeptidase family serine peptidase, partial [Pseudomonadota bacterium]|nr:prolyl oligopeptidase family serine peptidase [Pseudomonadota bacterium]